MVWKMSLGEDRSPCYNLECTRMTHNSLNGKRGGLCDWCWFAGERKGGKKRDGGHGQGEYTPDKVRNVVEAVRTSVILSNGPNVRDYRFWYGSLNCGCGETLQGDEGEPVSVLKMLRHQGRSFHAYLCDRSKDYVSALQERLWREHFREDVYYKVDDNKYLPDIMAAAIREEERSAYRAVGCIVSDPNGPSIKTTPYERLREMHADFPCIDLIMNINYGTMARTIGVGQIKGRPVDLTEKWPFTPSVRGIMSWFKEGDSRIKWLVSRPLGAHKNRGANKYIVLIGRSVYDRASPRHGFHPEESRQAQQWLDMTEE